MDLRPGRLLLAPAFAGLVACAAIPSGGPWASGPGQTLSIRDRHQCDRCHGVEAVFGPPIEVSGRDESPEPRPEAAASDWAPEPGPLPVEGGSCAGCHRAFSTAAEAPARLAQGRTLYGELFDRYLQTTGTRYCHVPALSSMERFRAGWLREYLEAPYDVRPNLLESMIRHRLTPAEAESLVAGWNGAPELPEPPRPSPERLSQGQALFDHKSCGLCHLFGNRVFEVASGWQFDPLPRVRLRALAPDLQHARHRLDRRTIARWIRDLSKVKPTAEMPRLKVSLEEAEALADFVYFADPGAPAAESLTGPSPYTAGAAPPSYQEVDEKVFGPICRHCHSNPFLPEGDRGPGDTGGFGYRGLGLSFESHEHLLRGSLAPDGGRRSVFREGASGEPVILERLRARYLENARDTVLPGRDLLVDRRLLKVGEVPGMPLGLPALTPEQFSLVERWVRGGRPPP
ncbi:MAG: hypothetical protein ACYC8T_21685 [Myxococcaceae bacterium]